ncbi:MAG TPA: hypothetical protein VK179_20070 [Bacteroidales bacterium]|nr:hypothetical protein [Bacteroidales bacterium]
MTSSLRLKKSVFSSWINFTALLLFATAAANAQLAAFHDNQDKFHIFDRGKLTEAEYLPVNSFSVGGNCLLYVDNRNHLKMYHNGQVSELEVSNPTKYIAKDYLAVYSIGGIVRIIDNGRVFTVSTNSVTWAAEDSLVTFYDVSQQLLAVYYKGEIHMLEDGLAGSPANQFRTGSNLVAYVSSRTKDFKIFYGGENREIEPFISGGSFKTGRDVVAWVNQGDQKMRVFLKGEIYDVEDFPPASYQVGDGIVAYIDNTGSFKVFTEGDVVTISSFKPDFYRVVNGMVIYGEQGYFKVWYNDQFYTLESFTPGDFKAEWSTIVYRDVNRNVKVFSAGESKVLTYDIAEETNLYRDVIVVNKGMNNNNVYYRGKKY